MPEKKSFSIPPEMRELLLWLLVPFGVLAFSEFQSRRAKKKSGAKPGQPPPAPGEEAEPEPVAGWTPDDE